MSVENIDDVSDSMFFRILDCIIGSGEHGISVLSIAKGLDTREQNVYYHIPRLVSSGMIYKSESKYCPQPIFLSEAFSSKVSTSLEKIAQFAIDDPLSSVYIEDASDDDVRTAMYNCIQVVILSQLSELIGP